MRKMLSFQFILLSSIFILAQQVKGKVNNTNGQAVNGVLVYIDGSQISTMSNPSGDFLLNVPSLKQGSIFFKKEGFVDVAFSLKDALDRNLKVVMEKEMEIEEVKIVGFSNKNYKKYIEAFRNEFLGFFRPGVTIKNEKDLLFGYDPSEKILYVKTKKPLLITNEYLGYHIVYNLIRFSVNYRSQYSTYNGTSYYTPIKASKRKQLTYKMNRLNSYYGSAQQFFRAVFNNKVAEEGFITDHIKAFSTIGEQDIAVIKQNIPSQDFRSEDGQVIFSYSDILGVRYKKYLFDIRKSEVVKTNSYISMESLVYTNENRFIVTSDGNYSNPSEMIFQKSWAVDKIAKTLPLDYDPTE